MPIKQSKRLFQIDLMRVVVIIMLVLMHCLTMYGDDNVSWDLPYGINKITAYSFGQKLTYAFLLESFTFMSGYVYSYGVMRRADVGSFANLLDSKLRRLIFPSLLFSLLYFCLFRYNSCISIKLIYDILMGMGHMWYLPMLFFCFVITYWIIKINISEKIIIGILLVLSVLSIFIPNYFRLSQTLYYEFFFYFGVLCFRHNIKIRDSKLALVLLFLVVPGLLFVKDLIPDNSLMVNKGFLRLLTVSYGLIGTISLYSLCDKYVTRISAKRLSYICQISTASMGMYLFQEFIIRIIYYKSTIPQFLGSVILPWFTFVVTVLLSYYLSILLRKYKIGRLIIG